MLSQSQYRVPAEWWPQSSMWVAWPSHPELWPGDLLYKARHEVAEMVHMASRGTPFIVVADGEEAMSAANLAVGDIATVIGARFGDIWLRDTGPVFTNDGSALRFETNGWGGKYIYPFDDQVGDTIADLANCPAHRFNFVLEGGSVEHNGARAILTTRQCLLNPNRNHWDEHQAVKALKQAFNSVKVYWLDEGLLNDHTDGHVDNIARFVSVDTVLCQRAFGINDPNADLYRSIAQTLKNMGFKVVQIPSPGRVEDEQGNVMPASHLNFIITNKVVVVPTYATASSDEAIACISLLFPQHKVIGVNSRAVLSGGGSFHCITQQQPQVIGDKTYEA